MKRFAFLAFAGSCCLPAAVMATNFGTGFRESWDSYATGQSDPTYINVWDSYQVITGTTGNQTYNVTTDRPTVISNAAQSISTPQALQIPAVNKNRMLVNNLADGKVNGTAQGVELSSGQWLIPDATVPLNNSTAATNYDNFQFRYYMTYNGTGSNRAKEASYVEVSYGNIHAPALNGAMTPLTTPINVLAIGKLNNQFTYVGGANPDSAQANVANYFFDGKQWVKLSSMGGTISTVNDIVARIYNDAGVWKAFISFLPGTGGNTNTQIVPLQFDPTTTGFNTVSLNILDSQPGLSGNAPSFDDVWVAGGLVVPEPATLGLLGIGGLMMFRRRR